MPKWRKKQPEGPEENKDSVEADKAKLTMRIMILAIFFCP